MIFQLPLIGPPFLYALFSLAVATYSTHQRYLKKALEAHNYDAIIGHLLTYPGIDLIGMEIELMHHAVLKDQADLAELVLYEHGSVLTTACLNAAIHWAAKLGHAKVLRVLLVDGRAPLDFMKDLDNIDLPSGAVTLLGHLTREQLEWCLTDGGMEDCKSIELLSSLKSRQLDIMIARSRTRSLQLILREHQLRLLRVRGDLDLHLRTFIRSLPMGPKSNLRFILDARRSLQILTKIPILPLDLVEVIARHVGYQPNLKERLAPIFQAGLPSEMELSVRSRIYLGLAALFTTTLIILFTFALVFPFYYCWMRST